jgi:membrane protease YdiL (CAAX protease family)
MVFYSYEFRTQQVYGKAMSGKAMSQMTKKKLALFLVLTTALSAVFHVVIARAGSIRANSGLYVAGLMWSPGAAALVTQLVTEGSLRGLGWRWGKTRYQLLSIALPLAIVSVTYAVIWLTGLGGFPDPAFVEEQIMGQLDFEVSQTQAILIYAVVSATYGLAASSLTALGEEIGWRGFLVPELARPSNFTKTALISGTIWAVWHYPGMVFADYGSEAPIWYGMICFTVMAVAFSVIMAWIRLRSGSVWTAMFLHAAHNVFVQRIFTPLTADTGVTEYVIDEFGAGLAIVYAMVAFVFWRMRDRLQETSDAENVKMGDESRPTSPAYA